MERIIRIKTVFAGLGDQIRSILRVGAGAILLWLACRDVEALLIVFSTKGAVETGLMVMSTMHWMFTSSVLCFVAALLWRSMSIIKAAVIVLVALFGSDFVEVTAHPFLAVHGIHPMMAAGYRPHDINPQWLKVLLIVPTAAICLICLSRSAWRTPDRIFLVLIACSATVTLFAFHAMVRYGVFEPGMRAVLARIDDGLSGNVSEMSRLCRRWDADCFRVSAADPSAIELVSVDGAKRLPSQSELQWFSSVIAHLAERSGTRHVGLLSDQDGTVSPPRRAVGVRIEDGQAYGVSLRSLTSEVEGRSQAWFCFLSILAHGTWFFGGLGLLGWHKWRRPCRNPSARGADRSVPWHRRRGRMDSDPEGFDAGGKGIEGVEPRAG